MTTTPKTIDPAATDGDPAFLPTRVRPPEPKRVRQMRTEAAECLTAARVLLRRAERQEPDEARRGSLKMWANLIAQFEPSVYHETTPATPTETAQ